MAQLVNTHSLPKNKYARIEISVATKETAIRLAKTLVENRLAAKAKLEPDPVYSFNNLGNTTANEHTISAITETKYAKDIQKLLNHFIETRDAEMLVFPIEQITPSLALKITENLGSLPTV